MKTKNNIINEIKTIILKYAKPTRIYLYGSQANGEANKSSDIDIAYDDENFKDHYLIDNDIKNISTLVKLDVKNIAKTEERFKNRVKSTGRVLYSSTKQLRAQDGLYNFSNALDRFASAVDRYEEFKNEGFEDVYLDLIVKRFEFTYEMSWKALKRYLEFLGFEPKSPRMTFKEAYAQQLIEDEDVWLDMIEQRNLTSHIYDESEIEEILNKRELYKKTFTQLKAKLEAGLA
ncbi:MAG: HI0074 family nucleotidyltransferase substrate-binding subunit [Sulfuricurvum sp.]|nr:HI0074 family nucleotidyltransferase substrate-binding subunit [Sulfuricurvum sp.]MDD5385698.1 HI0074 family nucleotidyltransferase substrate-binding subunit [Sulfuricurvum sp.]